MKNTFATFADPSMAEKAGGALLDHGVDAAHISIIFPEGYNSEGAGKLSEAGDHAEHVARTGITTTTVADAQVGAARGAGVGLAAGTLAALAAVFIPGFGLVLGGGALAMAVGGLVGTTAAGALAGGVTGYLKDQGVPGHVAHTYDETLRAGGALVTIAAGDEDIDFEAIETLLVKYGGGVSSYYTSMNAVAEPAGRL